MAVRRKVVRTYVERLLASHRVKAAPVDVDRLALALGAEVRREPADDELSGFLFRDHQARKAVIGVNRKHHPNRQRFTIAHEIGHFLLHEGERVFVDRLSSGYHVNLRNEDSSKGINEEEIEANLFAAELLMPQSFLEADLSKSDGLDLFDDDILKILADKYQVSIQALTYRLANLGYIR
jgi:Zn-dependent peptidase ImmA (M78 family)